EADPSISPGDLPDARLDALQTLWGNAQHAAPQESMAGNRFRIRKWIFTFLSDKGKSVTESDCARMQTELSSRSLTTQSLTFSPWEFPSPVEWRHSIFRRGGVRQTKQSRLPTSSPIAPPIARETRFRSVPGSAK